MEARMQKYRQLSPEQTKVWAEPPQKLQGRKAPVVYYLCRNRHLEHPHFIEVPLSSPEGLYLKDVIDRLNVLRGKGMASMYSWSCKRSYRNGFVWHDLSEGDLILPVHGNEFVLKGSELLEGSPPDRFYDSTKKQNLKPLPEPNTSRSQDESSSSSSMMERPAGSPSQYQPSSPLDRSNSTDISPDSRTGDDKDSICASTLTLTEYKVSKLDRAADASTQTDYGDRQAATGRDTCTRGVSTDETLFELDCSDSHPKRVQRKQNSETRHNEISSPPSTSSASSCGKTETLESLMRADVKKTDSFSILEEERATPQTKLKASKLLMQFISCGSMSVKDRHSFGIKPTYRPRFTRRKFSSPMFSSSMTLGELDCFDDSSRFVGMNLQEKEYFSGSLIETKKHYEDEEKGYSILKRSSSYNDDRTCGSCDSSFCKEKDGNSVRTNCIPLAMKYSSQRHVRNETKRSPLGEGPRSFSTEIDSSGVMHSSASDGNSKRRIFDPVTVKRSSRELDSGKEEMENLIKLDERLASGARVIIQSKTICDGSR